MVLVHLKSNDESLFLAEVPAATPTDAVIADLVHLHNTRLRIERLCTAVDDLAKYGAYKPISNHGYTDEDLAKFAKEDANGSSSAPAEDAPCPVVMHEGREYLHRPDPTGRRNGFAPLQSIHDMMYAAITEAQEAISKKNVQLKVKLTRESLDKILANFKGAVTIAYPMGLPEFDPVQEILDDTEDIGATVHAKTVLDPNTATLWWAGKELKRGKLLSDFVGRNDKTTIIAKLQRKGTGAPMREPPLDERGQRELMAYYHKKQEELKRLEEDEDDAYLNSAWANPKALKSTFHGIGSVAWKVVR
ncbi:hypothetical protein AMAG_07112 [Allomyces macrogynus ATCC 38327]|uniref:Uncharacterized protein n=1 Tax=Allomyces macrogynus (strain ATCC 38327) TaxID=578462 RepID=A0A0L0SH56_ALLM3|nr:hypothetical protein AMAG_07112 [Allomyces macrogynus ATCC 38327]|eukprot:KNE61836.1 hypothetical protein AMAG_07112 [Allomyces macrogynus ATCC 38327]